MQGTVAECGTALDTLGAADAEILIDRVLIKWRFDKGAYQCAGRAELIFSGGILKFYTG